MAEGLFRVLRAGRAARRAAASLRPLVRPSTAGAVYVVLWSGLTLIATLSDDRIQGVHVHSVHQLIATQFRGDVVRAAGLVMAVAVLTGLVGGTLAGALVRLRDRLAERSPRGPGSLALSSVAVLAVAHAIFWLHDVAVRPQLYDQTLYARGGARKALELLATQDLGPHGILGVGALVLALWLALPLRPWAELPGRVKLGLATLRTPIAGMLFRPPVLATCAITLGLLAVGFVDSFPRRVPPRGSQPNVLIVAADSLRADRITPRIAPHMSALAHRGVRFERAYVPVPRTFPSWVSIATGLFPHHHGIRNMFPRWEERQRELHAMPASFAHAGYQTAVVSDFAGDIFRRVDLGFSRIHTPTFNLRELIRERTIDAQTPLMPLFGLRSVAALLPSLRELHNAANASWVTSDALQEIDHANGRPFFVTVFYSTAHFPYAAPAPYYSRFTDPAYRGRFRYQKAELLGREKPPDTADVKQIRALYDGSVAAVDDAVADLLRGLRARGLDRDTIVVLTADHGESLYEPGRGQGHGDHLFGEETTKVPLVIYDPRAPKAHQVPDVVQSIDIAPTLCALAKVSCHPGMDGRSLVALMEGRRLPPRPAFAETGLWFTESIPEVPGSLRLPYPDLPHLSEVLPDHQDEIVVRKRYEELTVTAKHRMIENERYKLIYIPTRDGVKWQLYDVVADPGEQHNVIAEQPEVAEQLERRLWRWMLQDRRMERRTGYLLPRPGAFSRSEADHAVRLGGT